jgi:phosphate transport system substrate-binding protein
MHQSSSTLRKVIIAAVVLVVAVVAIMLLTSGKKSDTKSATSGAKGAAGTLLGAGSTFQEPLVVKWSGSFHKTSPKVDINYQGVGSGAGIEQFTKQTAQFGATDAPMKDEELAAAKATGGAVLHVPVALGAVVPTYNLPGVDKLRLDGPTLADIFLGKVTKWNDKAIKKLNPGVKLPSTPIAVVHRGDSSGTSYVFTGYLAAVSGDWKSGPGQDKAPKWPTGSGAQGNDGVAAAVQQQEGAIGYNEIAYALQNDMQFAQLKNEAGNWVTASLKSTTAAGDGVTYPADLRFSLLDGTGEGAWPIVSATWQLVWKDPAKGGLSKGQATALKSWLTWELTVGQSEAAKLDYAPLPPALRDQALAAVKTID